MRVSLRAFISAVSALSVAAVAAITLGITLTSSLAALRSVGTGQAAALLRAAQLNSEGLFDVPQSAIEALQNTSRGEAWPWPANSAAVRREWLGMHDLLLTESQGRLSFIHTSYADNSGTAALAAWDPSGEIALVSTVVIHGTPVNETDPRTGVENQTGLPTEYTLRYRSNRSLMDPADPRFFDITARYEYSNYAQSSRWLNSIRTYTGDGRRSISLGVYAVAALGVRSYIPFVGVLYRAGTAPGTGALPYGVTYAALLIDDLNDFLRDSRATPGTLAVAVDRSGYLLATSAPDRPIETVTQVAAGSTYGPGCITTEESGGFSPDPNNYLVCRAHGTAYGHAGLTAAMGRPDLTTSATRTVALIDTDDGVFFAGGAPVRMRFSGMTVHLLLLMPEVDVLGDVVRSRNVAIGATCGAFVLAAAATFAAITLLLAPLSTIAERMHRAATFDDDETDESVSVMAEVAALQEAYYAMNEELNRIRSFVPQSVLVAGKGGAEDDEDDDDGDDQPTHTTGGADDDDTKSCRSARSARSNRSRRSHDRTMPLTPTAGAGAASTLMATKFVTVLVANASGFSTRSGAAGGDARGTAESLTALVAAVEDAVGTNGGVLGGFHGDHFTATFNAVRACASGPRRACATAFALTQFSGSGLRIKMGVAAGKCLVGNAGTATAKTFSVVGPAFPQAVLLERLSRLYGPECDALVTARVAGDVVTAYRFVTVDHVLLPPRQATLVAALLGPIDAPRHGAGGDAGPASSPGVSPRGALAGPAADNEWLYVLEARASGDPNAAHNAAFHALSIGDLAAVDAYLALGAANNNNNNHTANEQQGHEPRGDKERASDAAADHYATLCQLAQELRARVTRASPSSAAQVMVSAGGGGGLHPHPGKGPVTTHGRLHEAHLRR